MARGWEDHRCMDRVVVTPMRTVAQNKIPRSCTSPLHGRWLLLAAWRLALASCAVAAPDCTAEAGVGMAAAAAHVA